MTIATEWLVANAPGRMESHPVSRSLAHLSCTLQEQIPEEIRNAMCDATHHDDWKSRNANDDETFKLNVAFLRAHGVPKGEITTFSNVGLLSADSKHAR